MFSFIKYTAIQLAIVWGALQIGFSMQVIDVAKVALKDTAVCDVFEVPVKDGFCRLTGRLEGNIDRTWSITPIGSETSLNLSPDEGPLLYNVKDWHMEGGSLGTYGLVGLTLLLSGVLLWLQYLETKRSKAAKAQWKHGTPTSGHGV